MSYVDDDDLDEAEPEDRTVTLRRDQIRQLEKQAKTATEAQARAEAAERKLAFAEAGLSLSDPKMSYFVKGYDGELTAEAITEAATQAGFLGAPAPDDTAALNRIHQVSVDASNPDASPDAAYQAELAAATSTAEVTAIAAKYGRLAAHD